MACGWREGIYLLLYSCNESVPKGSIATDAVVAVV